MIIDSPIQRRQRCAKKVGFTLIEVLTATAILLIVVLVLLQTSSGMVKLWQSTSGTVSDFQSARLAFATVNRVLSRATLHTYSDYIDTSVASPLNPPFGNVRTVANAATFTISTTTPTARASELHFVSGPAAKLLGQTSNTPLYPGDAIFFQAPLGHTNNSTYKPLNRALNCVGFYIQYGTPLNLPTWLNTLSGATYRFRLIEAIQPTENMDLYSKTSTGSYNGLSWLPFTTGSTVSTENSSSYTTSVLGENILLLVIRPRLDPQDEQTVAPLLAESYSSTTENSIISPDYNYDSRAWEHNYGGTVSRTTKTTSTTGVPYSFASLMRNQLPSIVDVAMICSDNASLARFQNPATPPTALQVPATLFTASANLEQDLATYEAQLTSAHIRFRLFRSSVNMQGSSWINN